MNSFTFRDRSDTVIASDVPRVPRFYITVTYYYHNGTLVVLNSQQHEGGATSRDRESRFSTARRLATF